MIAGGVILSVMMVSCSVMHSHDDDYLTVPKGKVWSRRQRADSPMQQAFYPFNNAGDWQAWPRFIGAAG